jgi:hypothetical protein
MNFKKLLYLVIFASIAQADIIELTFQGYDSSDSIHLLEYKFNIDFSKPSQVTRPDGDVYPLSIRDVGFYSNLTSASFHFSDQNEIGSFGPNTYSEIHLGGYDSIPGNPYYRLEVAGLKEGHIVDISGGIHLPLFQPTAEEVTVTEVVALLDGSTQSFNGVVHLANVRTLESVPEPPTIFYLAFSILLFPWLQSRLRQRI